MRTTIDLPDNLHRIASGLAYHTGRSLSQTVSDLLERALGIGPVDSQAASSQSHHPATGLPLVRSSRPITSDDVNAIDDVR